MVHTHNRILLSHKRNNISYSDVDELRACHMSELSQEEKNTV